MSLSDKILDRARTARIAVAYALTLAIAGLVFAVKAHFPTGHLYVDWALWALVVPVALSAVTWVAARVRGRIVGARGERLWSLDDALLAQAALVSGALLLAWYLPRATHGGDTWDVGLTVAGGSFVSAAATMLARFMFQR